MLSLIFLAKVCYVILILFSFFCLYIKYYFNKDFAKYFFLSSLSFLIGLALIHLRYTISDFYSIVIANTILVSGQIYLYIAVLKLLGYEAYWKNRYFIPIGVIFIGYILFTYVYFNLPMRIFIFSVFFMISDGLIALIFWKIRNKKEIVNKISSLIFFIGFIIFLISVINSFIVDLNVNYLSNNYFFMLLPYLYLILFFLWMMYLLYCYSKKV